MDAESIAEVIATYLNDRDDIGQAIPRGTEIEVVTQAGERYLVAVIEP